MLVIERRHQERSHIRHLIDIALVLINAVRLSFQGTVAGVESCARFLDLQRVIRDAVRVIRRRIGQLKVQLADTSDDGGAIAYNGIHAIIGILIDIYAHITGKRINEIVALVAQVIRIRPGRLD